MSDLILVTGGAGTLGGALLPLLQEAGFRVRLLDLRPIDNVPGGVDMVVGDLRAMGDVETAIAGVLGVVHAAAWHGMHLRDHSRGDFWDLNVRGTYHLYEAAAAAGVRAIVFSSTMGVYGATRPTEGQPAARISEDLPRRPGEIYGLSKVIGEEISEAYTRMFAIGGASLRYGMFVPEAFDHAGIRFLYGGVDARDVARVNVIALQRLLRDGGHLGALNVFSPLPFDAADGHALRADPLTAIRRHWPDGPALLEARGVAPWGPIEQVYEIARVEAILGFRPQYGFEQYLDALRSGRDVL
jgi:nucleoside-diphosphate-sugar epimerase